MSSTSRTPITPTAFEVASVASHLMLLPANLVAQVTYSTVCKQALTLLRTAQNVLDQPPVDVPEPLARVDNSYRRPARVPDICPPARIEQD